MSRWARNNPEEAKHGWDPATQADMEPEIIYRQRFECCCRCDAHTGRAGQSDDSLYREDGTGPYCDDCFDQEPVIEAIQNVINQQQKDQNDTKP